MPKFIKIYLLIATFLFLLNYLVFGHVGLISYQLDQKINQKQAYKSILNKVIFAKKDESNNLYICFNMTKEPEKQDGEYLLKISLNYYDNYRSSDFSQWYYQETVSKKAQEMGYLKKLQKGYTVTFPESALKNECSDLPVTNLVDIYLGKKDVPFKPPLSNSVNDYPLYLEFNKGVKDIIYFPMENMSSYYNYPNFFTYASQEKVVEPSWKDEASNYLIVEVKGDRKYSPNKSMKYMMPLAIVGDFISAPFQFIVGAFILITMVVTGAH